MEKSVVEVRSVSLRVPYFVQDLSVSNTTLGGLLGSIVNRPKRRSREILSGISFCLKDGDRLALLGRNGAGKSTLLHVLSGAYSPTSGNVRVSGEVKALLNISLGFNGDATVEENVLLRGAALDLPVNEVRKICKDILEFAGLEGRASDRLYTLSAGQRLRLAFSVTTATRPDILLLDEWISAGDVSFIKKAQDRLRGIISQSRVVVLASHSVDLLKSICNKGLVIDDGELKFFGDIDGAISCYHNIMGVKKPSESGESSRCGEGDGKVDALSPRLLTCKFPVMGSFDFSYHVIHENKVIRSGELAQFRVLFEIIEEDINLAINWMLKGVLVSGMGIVSILMKEEGVSWVATGPGGKITCSIWKHANTKKVVKESCGLCHIVWEAL